MALRFSKKEFLEHVLENQKKLQKQQREYKLSLVKKSHTRADFIIEKKYRNSIDRLKSERNDLRAKVWVASGGTNRRNNQRNLNAVKCHVDCQEALIVDIKNLKVSISNMDCEMKRISKKIYDLSRKTVPDEQHQQYYAKISKKMALLQNQLEVGVRRECIFTADNARLRQEIMNQLSNRQIFNESYAKLVERLNSDKKYLIELIDYAIGAYDNCIGVYEKMNSLFKKDVKDNDQRKMEMRDIVQKVENEAEMTAFAAVKKNPLQLADMLTKEVRRREEFRSKHRKQINLYTSVVDKIMLYTQSESIEMVIDKFKQQESLYYSYFNYANEMSYHMTLLNNCVNQLYLDINQLKRDNRSNLQGQLEIIENLESTLNAKNTKNDKLEKQRIANDLLINNLLKTIEKIFVLCRSDPKPLTLLLGSHEHVDLVNVRRFLKILEDRVCDVTATVYIKERERMSVVKPYNEYVVKHVEKICDWPTELEDIVLTQQCPECAEGEAYNVDEGEGGVHVLSLDEIKHKLHEKVNQPEMQYRLHSISQCRLPRSRILAAKRNV